MATAIKQFSGTVGSTGGTSINWTNEDADLDLCLGNSIDKKKDFSSIITSNNTQTVTFNPDGSRIYIGTDGTTNGITSFDLSTNWDIESTLSNQTTFDYLTPVGETSNFNPRMLWNNNGTQILIITENQSSLAYYTCSTAYDISTASYTGSLEEFEGAQGNFNGVTWVDSGKGLVVSTQGSEYQIFSGSTAYDFSALKFLCEQRITDYSSATAFFTSPGAVNGGVHGNNINSIFLHADNTTGYNNTAVRMKTRVSGYPQSHQLLDRQFGGLSSVPGNNYMTFTPDGNYLYFIDVGGNYTNNYSGRKWLFRKPTSHTVAADQTIYTVPAGKVAKVTMNMSGQSANVYVGGDKIAQLKGGSSIRHTKKGHMGFKARDYVNITANPADITYASTPCTDFYARGGTTLGMGLYENEGPDFFMLTAGESLVLKNSVNVDFDIQVIEDNASS